MQDSAENDKANDPFSKIRRIIDGTTTLKPTLGDNKISVEEFLNIYNGYFVNRMLKIVNNNEEELKNILLRIKSELKNESNTNTNTNADAPGAKPEDYGGSKRKINKRKTSKRKTNKRTSIKRKTNKRKKSHK